MPLSADPPSHSAVAVVRLWREPDGALRIRLLWHEAPAHPTASTYADVDSAAAALRAAMAAWAGGDGSVTPP